MTKTFVCQQCGKEYTSIKKNSIFCSNECKQKYRESQRVIYHCDYCGKEIILRKSEYEKLVNDGKRRYCSRECFSKGAFTSVLINCSHCGKEFYRNPSMIGKNNYCSKECYENYKSQKRKIQHKICPICHTDFETYYTNQIYCSKKCRGISTRNRSVCICDNCGVEFDRKVSEVEKNNKHFCSVECKKEYFAWNKDDLEFLKINYGVITSKEISEKINNRHSEKEVRRKAAELGLSDKVRWSEEEEQILINNYSSIPMSELQKLLPNRSIISIIGKSNAYGLISYTNIRKFYTDDDVQYLKDNYLLKTDDELAKHLNRTVNAIKQKLNLLDLHRPFDPSQKAYNGLNDYIRSRLYMWKNKFREEHNYTCVVTGKRSNIIVHHCRGFNLLMEETMGILDFPIKDNFQDYTSDELDMLLNVFLKVQESYDACVCVNEDIHKLFHKEYGYGNNTQEQWDEFVINYHNGKYLKVA